MTSQTTRRRLRKLALGLVPALGLLALMELASWRYFYGRSRPEPLALIAVLNEARYTLARGWRQRAIDRRELPDSVVIFEQLYGPAGTEILGELQRQYADSFARLAAEVRRQGSRLLVLYIPPTIEHAMAREVADSDRRYLARLCASEELEFLDLTELFLERHPLAAVAHLPENLHLTRLGNRLLAAEVAKALESHAAHRASARFERRPELMGDLPPATRRVWDDAEFPFLVTVNSQGLRGRREVEFPKRKQRILLLGDSFTFGYNAHDAETYPAFLQRLLPASEVINAGVPGYTIAQESEMFLERARFTEPDVVVLQVLFNDLHGLLSIERNTFPRDPRRRGVWFGTRTAGRERPIYLPSDAERRFVEHLRRLAHE